MERLNLLVEDGVKAALAELAGSERKMGKYISDLVLSMKEANVKAQAVDIEQLHYAFMGLMGTVKGIDARLFQVESHLRMKEDE